MRIVENEPQNTTSNLFLTPVVNPKSNAWYKVLPVGVNTLAKMMKSIASMAPLDGKYTNSSGRKTVIQNLRDEFHPLEISELTGHANPEFISSYSHNPLEKQWKMSHKLTGYSPNANGNTTSTSSTSTTLTENMPNTAEMQSVQVNVESVVDHSGVSRRNDVTIPVLGSNSSGHFSGAVSGLFTGATFNNYAVSEYFHQPTTAISINRYWEEYSSYTFIRKTVLKEEEFTLTYLVINLF